MEITVIKKIFIIILVWCNFNMAFGRGIETMEAATKKMSELIEDEVQGLDSGLEESQFFATKAANSPFSFSGIELLVVPALGIEVPVLAGLEIFVEMEMIWAKVEEL
jgi:hypothetical protein